MKFIVFSSGSKGNCSAIVFEKGIVLIDCGISFKRIKMGFEFHDLDMRDITHCIITHEHTDHVLSLKTLMNKLSDIQIVLTRGTLLAYESKFKVNIINHKIINPEDVASILGETWEFFPTTHDARESIGFCIDLEDSKFSYLTDCGKISNHILEKLSGSTHLALESNYCPQMLANGRYPEFLKERVAGNGGHLSNIQAAEILKLCNDSLEAVCLMHLSENNNNPTTAANLCEQSLNNSTKLYVATQNNGAIPIIFE
ncbi:MAG: MBL fold metallo-hydrolase [Proteobacteria bacterium]|nr:MBL fold metallo-hydrolase [Pseudomonadota bacterium]